VVGKKQCLNDARAGDATVVFRMWQPLLCHFHHILIILCPNHIIKWAIVASRWIRDVLSNVPADRSLWNKEFGKLQKARMLEDAFSSFLPTDTHSACLEPFERHTCDSVKCLIKVNDRKDSVRIFTRSWRSLSLKSYHTQSHVQ
jgi:hypothetical protein